MSANSRFIRRIYNLLNKSFGPQYWWPGDTPFEVCIGAILTQNTNWKNVEKAITNLKNEHLLSPIALRDTSLSELAGLIRPAGYYNIKARRLKSFISFLFDEHEGSLSKMSKQPLEELRHKLLNVHGIGPETADSILLYACYKPIFVVDAYTKRIFSRHKLCEEDSDYRDIQNLFMKNLPNDVKLFNEYHALIVKLGKDYCKKKPNCLKCPLGGKQWNLKL